MKRKSTICCLLFLVSCVAWSQKPKTSDLISNLNRQLATAKGNDRIDILNELAEKTSSIGKTWINRADSQKHYATIALDEAEKISYNKGIAKALLNLASSQWLYAVPLRQAKTDASDLLKKEEQYLLRALPIAEKLNDDNLLGSLYDQLGDQRYLYNDNSYKINNWKKAIYYYQKSGNKLKEAELTTWLCEDYTSRGAFEEGITYCQRNIELAQEGLKEAKTTEEEDYRIWHVWNSLYDMAYVYELAGDIQTTKEYVLRADEFAKEHHSEMVNETFPLLAAISVKLGQYDSARYYLAHTKHPLFAAANEMWANINEARIFVDLKEYDSAISLLSTHLENYRKGKASWRILLPLARAYSGKKDFTNALQLARESLTHLNAEDRVDLMHHYEALAEINEGAKNYDSAYYYLSRFHKMKDSLLNRQYLWKLNKFKTSAIDEKRAAQLALLSKDNLIKEQQLRQQQLLQEGTKVDMALLDRDNKIKDQQLQLTDQKLKQETLFKEQNRSQLTLLDKDYKLKDQQLKQQTFIRNALFAGLFLLLLLSIFVVRWLSLRQKNERLQHDKRQAELQQQSAELEMQALRAQMNPHFIFNCLSSINKFILSSDSRAASDYLTRFSRLIRRVLTNSQLSMIPLSDEIEMLRLYLDMERLRFDNVFDYTVIYANAIEPENIYIPPMLLQPFCENAIWHGLMHKHEPGKLTIELSSEKDSLLCIITDNGIGRAKAAALKSKSGDHQKSFGLKITTERLALFNNDKSRKSYYRTEDVLDERGEVTGTKVSLVIKYKDAVREPVNA